MLVVYAGDLLAERSRHSRLKPCAAVTAVKRRKRSLVFAPLLTFTGVDGKMFAPMAIMVMLALVGAFNLHSDP